MPHSRTLLIIDDCVEDREVYRQYLSKDPHQSYRILETDSAEEGLLLCQKDACDLILLDLQLPQMDGWEFLDELRQQSPNLPVIILTGYGSEAIAVQAMKKGARDYLAKAHLRPNILQLTVRNTIERSRLQKQLRQSQERQRLIAMMSLRIRQSLELEQILQTAVMEVQMLLGCDYAAIYQFTGNGSDRQQNSQQFCDRSKSDRQSSIVCEAKFRSCCGEQPNLLATETNLEIPIILKNCDRIEQFSWGFLLIHHCSQKRDWQIEEIEMLHEVSVQLALAIQQAELLKKTRVALEEEQKLNAFKSKIVATVSHEYRTPLATILAAASTLKQHGKRLDITKKEHFLQLIENKCRHMSNLIDDILCLDRANRKQIEFESVLIELMPFFATLIQEHQESTSGKCELNLKFSGNLTNFHGDRRMLEQIFDNLISNAIKYSPDGGQIEIALMGKEDEVIFSFQDEGIGIPKEEQETIFQSFHRGSNVDTIPGTGLGLAIAKTQIELHKGKVSLWSELEQGTKITVILPKRIST
ncbi:sensor histidine kinase [Spirulina sp. 06S082]|uniref:sensor histidine kinase n=1 Tax=Spirulina sp. 06S082 TaxID=3110248 RepID=UPI002B1FC3DB|nr:ATP-binding protein [Spirulina sp. 06S082]MEA5471726.1 ATP-binding protein [Spirulina sp. 06S082]